MVTATAIFENWAQLPFSKQFKLYLSDVPYDTIVTSGEDITRALEKAGTLDNAIISQDEVTGEAVGLALRQLKTVQPGVVHISGSVERTYSRNAILIMVSVIDNGTEDRINRFWRLLSKSSSIAVFVTRTAFFASTQLLALPMAVMALTLLLAAAVFSRAIASYITTNIGRPEPMVHVMVNTLSEANQIIAKVMMLTRDNQLDPGDPVRAVQIEVDGHIFVDCKRVARRSPWIISMLGIMAEPFDLASLVRKSSSRGYGSLPQSYTPQSMTRVGGSDHQ